MADISILSRLVNGYQRNVDISQNALVVGSIKIGSSTPVEITKAIATKLAAVSAAVDADGTYDTRYHTKTALAANTGAALIGGSTGQNVEQRLASLEGSIGSGDASGITFDPTGTSLTATNVQDMGVELDSRVQATETVANAAIPATQKGAANGVATLDPGGKIPASQLPSTVMTLEGEWDASTNTPTLANGSGDPGQVYETTVAGTANFGAGPISFNVGDWVVYGANGVWYKSLNSNEVTSVNGLTGAVVLTTDLVNEGSTNLYHTDERAQDAVGSILTDTPTIDLSYDDAGNAITADVKDNSIGATKLTTGVADQNTIIGGNGAALQVRKAPTVSSPEVTGESLAASTIFAMRFSRAADAGFTAGRMMKADANASSTDNFDVQGLTISGAGASAGDVIEVVQQGDMSVVGHGFTVGEPLWLGSAGAITQTAPNGTPGQASVKVGTVKDADTIRVKIQVISGG